MTRVYVPVIVKYWIAFAFAMLWASVSYYYADHWIDDLAGYVGYFLSYFIILGIAIIPGFMNAFLVASILMDKRLPKKTLDQYPPITILVAAYNERSHIIDTIKSIAAQDYPGNLKVIVCNDGSTDDTAAKVIEIMQIYPWLDILDLKQNVSKSNALNAGLALVKSDLVITVDGDCYLFKDALKNLIGRYLGDPPNTAAVAGAILARNERLNLVTKTQAYDYFLGIAAVKRLQSMYQATLVAQGAFSVYRTDVVRDLGGWPHTVGEDIVLTWAILKAGYRTGYAEDACVFTNVPTTWKQFIQQRMRWSRGLIEAFKAHWPLLFEAKMRTLFIWWNLLFPWLDITYTFGFVPGIILAFMGIFLIAGPMTLAVLPVGLAVNYVLFKVQKKMFKEQGLTVRQNWQGFIYYVLAYSIILQPACVFGYMKEFFFGSKKDWGTK